jgi:hypothetical protein
MKDKAIRVLNMAYPKHEGSKLLNLLSAEPNRPVLSTVIELALAQKITLSEAEQGHYHPLGIPLTDTRTLREIDHELKRLTELKAHYLGETGAEESPFDQEIAQLTGYRKECTKPGGGIRNSNEELRKAYRRQAAAIRRLLAKAERDGHHEAVAEVKRTLKLGFSSCMSG